MHLGARGHGSRNTGSGGTGGYKVFVAATGASPSRTELEAVLERGLEVLGGGARLVPPGARVLVKPNITKAAPAATGRTADLGVLSVLVSALREAGAGSITIGEGSAVGTDTEHAFRVSGLADVADELGVPLLNLKRQPYVSVSVPAPLCVQEIEIARPVLEADAVVSLAGVKLYVDEDIKVSLTMKNVKGVVSDRHKQEFHRRDVHRAIADLISVVPPSLGIAAGITANVGRTMLGGRPFPLSLLFFGGNTPAADMVAAETVGLGWGEVPHLRWAAAAGLGPRTLSEIQVVPYPDRVSIREAGARAAAAARDTVPYSVPLLEREACTGCKHALESAAEIVAARHDSGRSSGDLWDPWDPVSAGCASRPDACVVMGTAFTSREVREAFEPEPGVGYVRAGVCVRELDVPGPYVGGCPPRSERLAEALESAFGHGGRKGLGEAQMEGGSDGGDR